MCVQMLEKARSSGNMAMAKGLESMIKMSIQQTRESCERSRKQVRAPSRLSTRAAVLYNRSIASYNQKRCQCWLLSHSVVLDVLFDASHASEISPLPMPPIFLFLCRVASPI